MRLQAQITSRRLLAALLTMAMLLQMQKIPDYEKLNIKDIMSYGGAMEHGEERAKKHDKAASLYNHVRVLIALSGRCD